MKEKNLLSLLRAVVEKLQSQGIQFALAGGIAASLYRDQNRLTEDIDLLFFSESIEHDAKKIIEFFGYKASFVKLHQLKRLPMMNKKAAPALIVVGRNSERSYGIDFILPAMPWFDNALSRAQSNQLDFGFGSIPCLTVEDMILAKVYAERRKDEDDLISIFSVGHDLDLVYLASEMKRLNLKFSKEVLAVTPSVLKKVLKKK